MDSYGDDGSGVVNTAWALLALSEAKCPDVKAVKRGVQYLIKRQLPCGDWPQEGISGVFNRSVGITYTAYRNVRVCSTVLLFQIIVSHTVSETFNDTRYFPFGPWDAVTRRMEMLLMRIITPTKVRH